MMWRAKVIVKDVNKKLILLKNGHQDIPFAGFKNFNINTGIAKIKTGLEGEVYTLEYGHVPIADGELFV